jgi:hypothetical protein
MLYINILMNWLQKTWKKWPIIQIWWNWLRPALFHLHIGQIIESLRCMFTHCNLLCKICILAYEKYCWWHYFDFVSETRLIYTCSVDCTLQVRIVPDKSQHINVPLARNFPLLFDGRGLKGSAGNFCLDLNFTVISTVWISLINRSDKSEHANGLISTWVQNAFEQLVTVHVASCM